MSISPSIHFKKKTTRKFLKILRAKRKASSHQREEAKEEKSINDDDTAPPLKKTATLVWYGQDISGNEEDSILRALSKCFSDGYHSIWAGFYNQGFPAFPNNRHMLWHKKYRQTNKPQDMTWFEIEEKHMMEAYVQRHKDEKSWTLLRTPRRMQSTVAQTPDFILESGKM